MTESIAALFQGWPPGLLLVVAAVPIAMLPHKINQVAMLMLPVIGLAHLVGMPKSFGTRLNSSNLRLK